MTLSETLQANSCVLVCEETSENELRDLDKQLPSDTHLVITDKGIYGVRAYKSVDIFDAFFDEGHIVKEIRSGFGLIKPKLYNATKDDA